SVSLLHAKWRPPPATHAAISSAHARRHCLASEAASTAGATRSTASSASGALKRRILPPCLIPRASLPPHRKTAACLPEARYAAGEMQARILPQALCHGRKRTTGKQG